MFLEEHGIFPSVVLEVPVLVESFWENEPKAGTDLNLKLGRNMYIYIYTFTYVSLQLVNMAMARCHPAPPGEG